MLEPLRELIAAGLPTLGTCAGLILLAERVTSGGLERTAARGSVATARAGAFATLPATVQRNAYGRQLGSFHAIAPFCGAEGSGAEPIPMTFIRAPRITGLQGGALPLVLLHGEAVAVQAGNQIGCAFHPELDDSDAVYERFLELVESRRTADRANRSRTQHAFGSAKRFRYTGTANRRSEGADSQHAARTEDLMTRRAFGPMRCLAGAVLALALVLLAPAVAGAY